MRVYLIGAYRPQKLKPDAIKIGVALDVNARLRGVQNGNHLECRIIATWLYESRKKALEVERLAHYVFRRHRLYGEWFEPLEFRLVDFLNSKKAEEIGHGVKTAEAFASEKADEQIFESQPWLKEITA